MNLIVKWFVMLVAGVMLSACSYIGMDNVLPDKQVEYRRERIVDRHLEVPPDLTSDRVQNRIPGLDTPTGVSASYSTYAVNKKGQGGYNRVGAMGGVLPEIKDISIKRVGQERWLVIDAPADAVWPQILDFWQENGILMAEQDPSVGVMRTDWLENISAVKTDMITRTLRGVFSGLYDSNLRDKYRVRLERVNEGKSTELYLTHFGMVQKINTTGAGESEQFVWNARPRDPQLEAVMLRQIMVHLGVADAQAEAEVTADGQLPKAKSQLFKAEGAVSLLIYDAFPNAWRLTGLALDRVGFAVEDRDRTEGVYYVRYNDPSAGEVKGGWLSSLAFWKSNDIDKANRYVVRLNADDEGTRVIVLDDKKQRDSSATALRILTLVHEQIK